MNEKIVEALTGWPALVLPETLLVLTACVLFVGATTRGKRDLWIVVSLLGIAAAVFAAAFGPRVADPEGASLFAAPVLADHLALWTRTIALCGGAVLVLLSAKEVSDPQAGEYFGCLLVIVAGTSLVGSANDLMTLFLSLEMISIPMYVLLYLPRHTLATQEAAAKYFLLSVFSSALLLFGFSYLYGLSGTTNLPALVQALSSAGPGGVPAAGVLALVLVVAGLGFRIAAVPFHFYAPDVYQGAPTPGAALLAFVPKVAGFVALIRVLGFAPHLPVLADLKEANVAPGLVLGQQVSTLLWILAAATMTLGNVLALLQENLKRILAYSGVAHAGYMLIGLAVAPYLRDKDGPAGGVEAVLFYLAAYAAMTLGAFGVLIIVNSRHRPVETVDDLAGLSRSHPSAALALLVFLLSLIGIPLTGGFVGKLLLFVGAVSVRTDSGDKATTDQSHLFLILAVIGAVNAAIGAWYYLRIAAAMYLRDALRPVQPKENRPAQAAVWLCVAATLFLGVCPATVRQAAQDAVPKPAAQAAR